MFWCRANAGCPLLFWLFILTALVLVSLLLVLMISHDHASFKHFIRETQERKYESGRGTQTQTYRHTHRHTDIHTHTYTQTHTHTHTHKHTRAVCGQLSGQLLLSSCASVVLVVQLSSRHHLTTVLCSVLGGTTSYAFDIRVGCSGTKYGLPCRANRSLISSRTSSCLC